MWWDAFIKYAGHSNQPPKPSLSIGYGYCLGGRAYARAHAHINQNASKDKPPGKAVLEWYKTCVPPTTTAFPTTAAALLTPFCFRTLAEDLSRPVRLVIHATCIGDDRHHPTLEWAAPGVKLQASGVLGRLRARCVPDVPLVVVCAFDWQQEQYHEQRKDEKL